MLWNMMQDHARKLFAVASKINTLAMFMRTDEPFITKDWARPPFYSLNEAAYCEPIKWAATTILDALPDLEAALRETIELAEAAIREHERNEVADVVCGNRTVEDVKQENAPFVSIKVLDIGAQNAARKPYFERRRKALARLEAIAWFANRGIG